MSSSAVGCYVLANDPFHNWLEPFVFSFRKHVPAEVALHVIPFNSQIDRVSQLCDDHAISIVQAPAFFDWADELLVRYWMHAYKNSNPKQDLHGGNKYGYLRKLYTVFHGMYDYNIFLDADTVVLKNFLPALNFACSDIAFFATTEAKYCHSSAFCDALPEPTANILYNTGGFAAKSKAITAQQVENTVDYLIQQKFAHTHAYEQPIINAVLVLHPEITHQCLHVTHWSGDNSPIAEKQYFEHSAGVVKR